jgi:hypothetical protein
VQQSVQQLPEGYHLDATLDLAKRKGLAILLNLLAAASVIPYSLLFFTLALRLRPSDAPAGLEVQIAGIGDLVTGIARLLLISVVVLLLHEAVHGLCFRLYTGVWGTFAFKGLYAYAAAPDWYLPRSQYLVTALAPYIGLSLLGVVLLPVMPRVVLGDLLLFLVFNAAGAMGDLAAVAWLLSKPRDAYLKDQGDALAIYLRKEGAGTAGV